jgi:hypothetical protein
MHDLSSILPEMFDQLDKVWEMNQAFQKWIREKLEEIERNAIDEHDFERQAVSATFFAYCAMHKLLEVEEPRMNIQEFQQYWESYKARKGI